MGPSVASQTPFSPFVMAAPGMFPGMSLPVKLTFCAWGA
jgi:hypothetical protein